MFNKHFKPDQKVLIQITSHEMGNDRIENLSAACQAVENGILTLKLPYTLEPSIFSTDTRVAVITESMGMGLKGKACFHAQNTATTIQLRFDGDLQFFQRRPSPRVNVPIGVRYSRANGTLSQVRQQWLHHIHKLADTQPGNIPQLPSGQVNVSSGGIRLAFRNRIEKGQLCLLLLQIAPDTLICTVAEVVWTHNDGKSAACTAGLQFTALLAEDRDRLEKFIRTSHLAAEKNNTSSANH